MRFTDQLGDTIELATIPRRIISLVPSQTELLYDLGLSPIAQTIFCIHPTASFKTAEKIGGTKKLAVSKIRELKPDLIIGNKEENVREQIDELRSVAPVWMSDVNTIEDAIDMIQKVGELVGKTDEATALASRIQDGFNRLLSTSTFARSCVYLIWEEPLMAVGTRTYIHDVLRYSGYQNLVQEERYPVITDDDIKALNPDVILLSTEPFPFKEKHVQAFAKRFPSSRVELIDAELYSWYGSRMLKLIKHLTKNSTT